MYHCWFVYCHCYHYDHCNIIAADSSVRVQESRILSSLLLDTDTIFSCLAARVSFYRRHKKEEKEINKNMEKWRKKTRKEAKKWKKGRRKQKEKKMWEKKRKKMKKRERDGAKRKTLEGPLFFSERTRLNDHGEVFLSNEQTWTNLKRSGLF